MHEDSDQRDSGTNSTRGKAGLGALQGSGRHQVLAAAITYSQKRKLQA